MGLRSRSRVRTALPDDWQPNEEDLKAVAGLPIDYTRELAKFKDYHQAHGTLMASWSAAFRYWMRRAVDFVAHAAPTPKKQRYFGDPDRPYAAWRDGSRDDWEKRRKH